MNIVMFVSLTPVISDWPTDRGCVVSPVSRIPQFTTAPQGQRDFLNQTILDNSRHLSDTGTAYNITFNSRIMGFKDYVCLKEKYLSNGERAQIMSDLGGKSDIRR